jgi:hypothetical protein
LKKTIDSLNPDASFTLSDRIFRLKVTRCAKKNKTNTIQKTNVANKTIQESASYGKLACYQLKQNPMGGNSH